MTIFRLRRAGPTTSFQLRLLPPPSNPHLHHLHSLQRPPLLLASPSLRPYLFPNRKLHLQIPASLRHGPSPTLHRQSLVHNLRPNPHRHHRLPSRHGRRLSSQNSNHPLHPHPPPHRRHHLVHQLLPALLRTPNEIHRPQKPA